MPLPNNWKLTSNSNVIKDGFYVKTYFLRCSTTSEDKPITYTKLTQPSPYRNFFYFDTTESQESLRLGKVRQTYTVSPH